MVQYKAYLKRKTKMHNTQQNNIQPIDNIDYTENNIDCYTTTTTNNNNTNNEIQTIGIHTYIHIHQHKTGNMEIGLQVTLKNVRRRTQL